MTTGRTDHLHHFLTHQRWFAGKGREFAIESVEPLDWLTEPGEWPAARIELVTVRYTDAVPVVDGAAESAYDVYQLPVSYRLDPGENLAHAHIGEWKSDELGQFVFAFDACFDKEAMSAWLRGLLAERTAAGTAFHRLGQLDIDPTESALVISAEQSNTSVVFGEAALLKVFRRVHPGRNPDIVVHEVMTKNDCANVARLFGWVDGTWTTPSGAAHGDLAMFSEFFRTASDGWELALTSVRDLYAEGDLHADEVGGDFAAESRRLGHTTARVHHDLARLMPTATLADADLTRLTAGMYDRLDRAVAAVPALADHAAALRACYAAFVDRAESLEVQHIHGDLHLGQVMRTVGGWRLIDFEGEPGRPFEERGMLDTPLRDVAGMLRSFDYAARALLIDRGDSAQLVYRATEWAERNRAAFCEGYAEVAGSDPRTTDVVLDAYETDKAVYEVLYEARMRPNWLAIPLAAIERLAGRQARKPR